MYKIQLPNFEGPYELMLYFIRRDELNIYDIPISKITHEFLNYIKVMQFFDLELAGEFILTTATLMGIKTKMLLPTSADENLEQVEDPRTELVHRLIEYKQIKEVTSDINNLFESSKYYYYRTLFDSQNKEITNNLPYKNATLFDLINAFNKVLRRNQIEHSKEHVVEQEIITVEEKINELRQLLKIKPRLSFFNILAGKSKEVLVVTLLSILDMVKMSEIIINQDDNFEDIFIGPKVQSN